MYSKVVFYTKDVTVKLRGSLLVKTHFKTNDNLKIAIGEKEELVMRLEDAKWRLDLAILENSIKGENWMNGLVLRDRRC